MARDMYENCFRYFRFPKVYLTLSLFSESSWGISARPEVRLFSRSLYTTSDIGLRFYISAVFVRPIVVPRDCEREREKERERESRVAARLENYFSFIGWGESVGFGLVW